MHLPQHQRRAGKREPGKLSGGQQCQLPRAAALPTTSMTAFVRALVAAFGQPREQARR
eukprot:CAMPEP_0172673636 /NCGR_PEP_ID=MMETSP1074-20121228/12264_1 /TAXON_ID=2916 /ORGANISM="Ceratium fusus, Strain PA161109" /LENGTH=57 /DNA_ID=CAMNT_0013490957 /DNA_START=312 /DNA_END=482 /DNA_ORIENTATION=-